MTTKKATDLVFDYSVLHHIEPTLVKGYASQFEKLLKPRGNLLPVCYSEKDNHAHGSASKLGAYGNTMFYRTAKDIKSLYSNLQLKAYKEAKLGKRLHHEGHYFLFTK